MNKDLEYRQSKKVGTAMMEQYEIMKKSDGHIAMEKWLYNELMEVLKKMHSYKYYDLSEGLEFAEKYYSEFFELEIDGKLCMCVHFKMIYSDMFLNSAKCFLNPVENISMI